MFRLRLNELRLDLQLAPVSPLLIKEGETAGDSQPTDEAQQHTLMTFVSSRTPSGTQYYLPGSSLRGVLRSAAERLVGRWQPALVRASEPFKNAAQERAEAALADDSRNKTHDGATVYNRAGPIERCFGHTLLRGRWVFTDAWPIGNPPQTRRRDGVGIDRATGAAREHIKYQFEPIVRGTFSTTLTLVNYELWQLGLLAHLLAALDSGDLTLGYGTRRGLGRVGVHVSAMRWRWYGTGPQVTDAGVVIPSLHSLSQPHLPGYTLRDATQSVVLPLSHAKGGFGTGYRYTPAANTAAGITHTNWDDPFWAKLGNLLPEALRAWPVEVAA